MAERVGFEPTARCRVTGFQDRLLKPLGHLSEFRLNKISYFPRFVNIEFPVFPDSKLPGKADSA